MVSSRVFMIVEIRHSKKITMKVKGCVKFDKMLLDWVTHLLMTKLRIIKKKTTTVYSTSVHQNLKMVEIILLATIKPAQATQKVLTCIYMYMYSIFDYFSVKLAINDKYSILVFVCFLSFFVILQKEKQIKERFQYIKLFVVIFFF